MSETNPERQRRGLSAGHSLLHVLDVPQHTIMSMTCSIRSRLKWWLAIPALLVSTMLVFVIASLILNTRKPQPIWSATSGNTPPKNFCVVLIPRSTTLSLYDKPDGRVVGTLNRAVVNELFERDLPWILVNEPEGEAWIQAKDLSLATTDTAPVDEYFGDFRIVYAARNPKEHRSGWFRMNTDATGTPIATLHLSQGDHWQEYIYSVSNGIVKPIEMYQVFGPGLSLGAGMTAGVITLGYVIVACVLFVCMKTRCWRAQGAHLHSCRENR